MKLLLFVLALSTPYAFAHVDLRVEAGQVESRGNRFQVPGDSGTEVSLPRESTFHHRVEAELSVRERGLVRLVYAPLTIDYTSTASENVVFNNTTFAAGQTLATEFKFNSYRAGYLHRFTSEGSAFQFWAGGTLKVRDARIAVSSASARDSYSNVGLVPLISLKSEWQVTENWRLDGQVDGLGAAQGRAVDGAVDVNRALGQRLRLGVGWRALEGGADNRKTENFTHLNYWYGVVRGRF